MLDGADNLLVLKTFAARIDRGPAKLPDFGASFAIWFFHTPMLHLSLLHRRCGAGESSAKEATSVWGR